MFLGISPARIDDKGRLAMPARFRSTLGGEMVLTKGQDRCLVVWTTDGFAEYANALRAGSVTSEKVRSYTRVLFASAHDCELDRQGRFALPLVLRQYAFETRDHRDVVFIGADVRIEIWQKTLWDKYLADADASFVELDGEVVPARRPL